jgi:Fe-S cluster assembly scaffold protein SufB
MRPRRHLRQLDDDLLFYLMARGLPKKEAESLLVQAFLGNPSSTWRTRPLARR